MKPILPLCAALCLLQACSLFAPRAEKTEDAEAMTVAPLTACRAPDDPGIGPVLATCMDGESLAKVTFPRCPASVSAHGAFTALDRMSGTTCAIRMSDDRVVFTEPG